MFCPRCATHNLDDAKYCRSCGADISLLPQVLSGQRSMQPEAPESILETSGGGHKPGRREHRRREKEKKPPTLEKAFENMGIGISFLVISVMIALFMPGGRFWWFWMLIPAFACFGEGMGLFVRLKREKSLPEPSPEPQLPASRLAPGAYLPPRNTSEVLMQPSSVTEHTTRHLSPEARVAARADEHGERPPGTLDSKLS